MGNITPLQSFLAGVAAVTSAGGLVALIVWRSVARLRRDDPDWFAKSRARIDEAVALRDEGPQLRRRQVELLERIARNQVRMIELMQESQRERHESPGRL